jgi:hypothetical protein
VRRIVEEVTHQQHYLTSEEDNVAEMMKHNPHPILLDQSA